LKAQAKQLADLRITAEALEKERDFYFQKLLAVEVRGAAFFLYMIWSSS
jgi:hypothetical protein